MDQIVPQEALPLWKREWKQVKGEEDLHENWQAKFCTSGASGSHVLVKGKQKLNQSWQARLWSQVKLAIFVRPCRFFWRLQFFFKVVILPETYNLQIWISKIRRFGISCTSFAVWNGEKQAYYLYEAYWPSSNHLYSVIYLGNPG
jgi:hypothetical protein